MLYEPIGIVDTGTTLILIASDAYSTYVSATGGVLDSATGLPYLWNHSRPVFIACALQVSSKLQLLSMRR